MRMFYRAYARASKKAIIKSNRVVSGSGLARQLRFVGVCLLLVLENVVRRDLNSRLSKTVLLYNSNQNSLDLKNGRLSLFAPAFPLPACRGS